MNSNPLVSIKEVLKQCFPAFAHTCFLLGLKNTPPSLPCSPQLLEEPLLTIYYSFQLSPPPMKPFLIHFYPHKQGCLFYPQNTIYVSLIQYVTHSCFYICLLHQMKVLGKWTMFQSSLYTIAPSIVELTRHSSSFVHLKVNLVGETSTYTPNNYWISRC